MLMDRKRILGEIKKEREMITSCRKSKCR